MPTPKKAPAELEATGVETIPITLSFDDIVEDFDLPATPDAWPFAVTIAYEDGKAGLFLKTLMGDEQFGRFMAAEPTVGKVNEFVSAYMEALGLKPGE